MGRVLDQMRDVVDQVIQGLRAVRDFDVNLAALEALRSHIAQPSRNAFLAAFLAASPEWAELWGVWQAQTTLQHSPVLLSLLHTLTCLVQLPPSSVSAPSRNALDSLASSLLTSNLRSVYFHLTSGERPRANAALHLLTHAVRRSPHHAALFLQHFDFSLSALPKLAAPPRAKRKRGDDGDAPGGDATQDGAAPARNWDAAKLAKRPTRACFCRLALAVLEMCGDADTLARALQAWQLLGPVLNQLAGDPPEFVSSVCQLLLTRVLPPENGVASCFQAAVLKESVLLQLLEVTRAADGDGDDSALTAARSAAQSVLTRACTSSAHGLLLSDSQTVYAARPAPHEGVLELSSTTHGVSAHVDVWCTLVAIKGEALLPSKPLVNVLRRVQFQSSVRHLELLTKVVEASPAAAAAVLGSSNLLLDPKKMDLIEVPAEVAAMCIRSAARLGSTVHAAAAAPGGRPPSSDSSGVRTLLDRSLPRACPRAALSRCLQHSSAAAAAAALTVLAASLSAVAPLCAALRTLALRPAASVAAAARASADALDAPSRGAAKGRGSPPGDVARQWLEFNTAFLHDVRTRLPDLQTLMVLYNGAVKRLGGPSESGAAPDAVAAAHGENGDVNGRQRREDAAGGERRAEGEAPESGGADGDGAADGKGPWSLDETVGVLELLLKVLRGYLVCNEEAFASGGLSPWKLLPENLAGWPPHLQLECLKLLQTSLIARCVCPEAAGVGGSWSAAFIKPLLNVMAASQSAAVLSLCEEVLHQLLLALELHQGSQAEVLPWLMMLPRSVAAADVDRAASTTPKAVADGRLKGRLQPGGQPTQAASEAHAIHDFVIAALTLLVRRPHEVYGMLLPGSEGRSAETAGLAQSGSASEVEAGDEGGIMLAAAMVREALRLLRSTRRDDRAVAAVLCFVVGAARMFLALRVSPRRAARSLLEIVLLEVRTLSALEHAPGSVHAAVLEASGKRGSRLAFTFPARAAMLASFVEHLWTLASGAGGRAQSCGVRLAGVAVAQVSAGVKGSSTQRAGARPAFSAGVDELRDDVDACLRARPIQRQPARRLCMWLQVAIAHGAPLAGIFEAADGASAVGRLVGACNAGGGKSSGVVVALLSAALLCAPKGSVPGPRELEQLSEALRRQGPAWQLFAATLCRRHAMTPHPADAAPLELPAAGGAASAALEAAAQSVWLFRHLLLRAEDGDASAQAQEGQPADIRRPASNGRAQRSWEGAAGATDAHMHRPCDPRLLRLVARDCMARAPPVVAAACRDASSVHLCVSAAALMDVARAGLACALGDTASRASLPSDDLMRAAGQCVLEIVQPSLTASISSPSWSPPAATAADAPSDDAEKVEGRNMRRLRAARSALCASALQLLRFAPLKLLRALLTDALTCSPAETTPALVLGQLFSSRLTGAPAPNSELESWSAATLTTTLEGGSTAEAAGVTEQSDVAAPLWPQLLQLCRRTLRRSADGGGAGDVAAARALLSSLFPDAATLGASGARAAMRVLRSTLDQLADVLELCLCTPLALELRHVPRVCLRAAPTLAEKAAKAVLAVLDLEVDDGASALLACLPTVTQLLEDELANVTLRAACGVGAENGAGDRRRRSHVRRLAHVARPLLLRALVEQPPSPGRARLDGSAASASPADVLDALLPCLALHPLADVATTLAACAPDGGWSVEDCACTCPPSSALSWPPSARLKLAVDLLTSTARSSGFVSNDSADHLLTASKMDAAQLCACTTSVIRCCQLTLASVLDAAASGAVDAVSARSVVDDVTGWLDGAIGDVVEALPDAARGSSAFAELAHAAAELSKSALSAALSSGGDAQQSHALLRCARRLWSALLAPEVASGANAGESAPSRDAGAHSDARGEGSNAPGVATESDEDLDDLGAGEGREAVAATSGLVCMEEDNSSEVSDESTSSEGDGADRERDADSDADAVEVDGAGGIGRAADASLSGRVENRGAALQALRCLDDVVLRCEAVWTRFHEPAEADSPPATSGASTAAARLPDHMLSRPVPLTSLMPILESYNGADRGRTHDSASSSSLCEYFLLVEVVIDVAKQYSSGSAELAGLADALLPQLLPRYGATMAPLDRAILRVLRALDSAAASGAAGAEASWPGTGGVLDSLGFLFGRLWVAFREAEGAAGGDADAVVACLKKALMSADVADCRRMALSVLFFPESVTLAGDEQDAYRLVRGPLEYADSPEAHASYDPSYVLPCMCSLLRSQALDAALCVASGWLALALRCLAADDEDLRRLAYQAVAGVAGALAEDDTTFREGKQTAALLRLVQNSVETPCQRLPTPAAVFFAEAATVIANPASPFYAAVNKFVLHRPTLDMRSVPMFVPMHDAGTPDWHRCRAWATALLQASLRTRDDVHAAARAALPEMAALAAAGDAGAAAALLRVIDAVMRVPPAAARLVADGLVPLVATVAARALAAESAQPCAAGAPPPHAVAAAKAALVDDDERGESVSAAGLHAAGRNLTVLALCLRALGAVCRTQRIWRRADADGTATQVGAALVSILRSLDEHVHGIKTKAAGGRQWAALAVAWLAATLHSFTRAAGAARHRRQAASALPAPFWLRLRSTLATVAAGAATLSLCSDVELCVVSSLLRQPARSLSAPRRCSLSASQEQGHDGPMLCLDAGVAGIALSGALGRGGVGARCAAWLAAGLLDGCAPFGAAVEDVMALWVGLPALERLALAPCVAAALAALGDTCDDVRLRCLDALASPSPSSKDQHVAAAQLTRVAAGDARKRCVLLWDVMYEGQDDEEPRPSSSSAVLLGTLRHGASVGTSRGLLPSILDRCIQTL